MLSARTALTLDELRARMRPRAIVGISALLLPYRVDGRPDWDAFAGRLQATTGAGLRPAVNMDTGYVDLLTDAERSQVLRITAEVLGDTPFVGGAFVEGRAGDLVSLYCAAAEEVRAHGGTPILFQSSALKALSDHAVIDVYRGVAERVGPILGFELGEMFAPFGRIYSLEMFADLLQIPNLVGIKHSSLDRELEWQRLALRDQFRPDFKLYTGNDLAIDMVIYGSDYLLGLSAFAPEAFALRDRLWADGDLHFFVVNDALQSLGSFAFRAPVPGYKHSAAQFLYLGGHIPAPAPHPGAVSRPPSDIPVLERILERLNAVTASI